MTSTMTPSLTRLDRILELVTAHESRSRDQDMKISDVGQRLSELEGKLSREWGPLWSLKVDRNEMSAKNWTWPEQ